MYQRLFPCHQKAKGKKIYHNLIILLSAIMFVMTLSLKLYNKMKDTVVTKRQLPPLSFSLL